MNIIKRLPAGVNRIINVDAPTLRDNLDNGDKKPMVRVRPADHPEELEVFHGVSINGPCEIFPTFEKPLPGTNGRGICYVTTTAELECLGE